MKKNITKIIEMINAWQLEKYAIWVIMAIAAYFRFTGLVRRDFWYDEAFTGVAVKENFSDMITMIINDVHPPLYYIVLKWFSFPFNYSVFGIRLFSAIFGLLAVWMVFMFTRELFNRRAALWAGFVAAISPFAIQYSQEARMYSMLVFFILAAAYFFLKGLKSGKAKYFVLWGLFTGLSMLTHYMGIIFALTYAFIYLVWAFYQSEPLQGGTYQEKSLTLLRNILPDKNVVMGYAVAFLVFLPWLDKFIHHIAMKGTNLAWVKSASFGDIITTVQMFLFGTPLGEMSSGMPQPNEIGFMLRGSMFNIAHISVRMVLAIMLGYGIAVLLRKEKKEKVHMLILFSFGFMTIIYLMSVYSALFSAEQQYFVARYLLPGAYFIFVFIGISLCYLRWQFVVGLFAIYFVLLGGIIPLKNSTGYNEMVDHVEKYKGNNVYVLSAFDYVIAKYYFDNSKLILFNYDWPQYDPAKCWPSCWAAIGPSLKRTENFDDLRKDPKAVVISNKPLKSNQYANVEDLDLVDQYDNILIYRFHK